MGYIEKKKYSKTIRILGALACGALVGACADNSYPGADEFLKSGLVVENSKVPILISVGRSSTSIDGRSRAGEDLASATDDKKNETKWNEPYIYVYAFHRTKTDDYTLTPGNGEDQICLVDNSLSTQGSLLGKEAQISTGSPYAAWTNSPLSIFYPINSEPYNFFSYYLDEMNVTNQDVVRTPENISLKIDLENWRTNKKERPVGMADLMYARAAESGLIDQIFANGTYTDEEKQNIQKYSFSGYTAQRGIQPTLQFHHAMARFKFEIEGKYQLDEGLQPYIYKIKVLDVPKQVLFTVAGNNPSAFGIYPQENSSYISEIFLHDYDPETGVYSELPDPETGANAYCDKIPNDNAYTQVGSYLILPANVQSYRCEIWMKQKINGEWKADKADVILQKADGQPIEQGLDYTVKMDVYGWQEMKVKIDVGAWKVGGWAEIDPDKEFTEKK